MLVGHSLGGVVAWWVAQRHPELVAAAFLEDPPLYMGEPAEHEDNGAVPLFRAILDAVARWKAQGMTAEQAAAELAARPPARTAALCDDVPLARAEALLRMDPGVLEGAIDRSTLAPTDTTSPVSVPVFLLAAGLHGLGLRRAPRRAPGDHATPTWRSSASPAPATASTTSATTAATTSRRSRASSPRTRSRRARRDQSGYSSLRQARGSSGPGFGVRSSRNEWYGATNGSGAITV